MEHIFQKFYFRQDAQKLKELILYISESFRDAKYSGKTKLNKLLFAVDFVSYEKYGKPITGVRYKKGNYGPVPASIFPILQEMLANKEIKFCKEKVGNLPQQRPVALRLPNLSIFSRPELDIIDEWISAMKPLRAVNLSKWSHELPLWDYSDEEGFIPYNRVYWKIPQSKNITDKDRQIADRIFKRTGGKPLPRHGQL